MVKRKRFADVIFFIVAFTVFSPDYALALQRHGGIEGLVIHQLAHCLFFWAMCDFSYRCYRSEFLGKKARRAMVLGALVLALWNVWAFAGHILAFRYQLQPLRHETGTVFGGEWRIKGVLDLIYYGLKMDHLVLVPSMLFFFLASRKVKQ